MSSEDRRPGDNDDETRSPGMIPLTSHERLYAPGRGLAPPSATPPARPFPKDLDSVTCPSSPPRGNLTPLSWSRALSGSPRLPCPDLPSIRPPPGLCPLGPVCLQYSLWPQGEVPDAQEHSCDSAWCYHHGDTLTTSLHMQYCTPVRVTFICFQPALICLLLEFLIICRFW